MEMQEIFLAIEKAIEETDDAIAIIDQLMAMSPQAKMRLADMLNGFVAYEPDVWIKQYSAYYCRD